MRRPLSTFIALLLAGMVNAASAAVSLQAQLSDQVTEVGSEVELSITITGANGDPTVSNLQVEGLDIQYEGPQVSRQIQMMNGQFSQTVQTTLVYRITPKREGDFTIPALTIKVDGNTYDTRPTSLKVTKGAQQQGGQVFAEIKIPKKTIYVGETLSLEVRLWVDGQIRLDEVTNAPELSGDSFSLQKFPRVEQGVDQKDGRTYRVFTFRTSMTPTKAGKLSIGPCDIPFVAQVPRQKQKRQRGFGSIFDDDFFDPFGAFAERKRYTAKAAALELDVKPLPTQNKPANFSGGIGQFTFDAEGSPSRIKYGDPVTMKIRVTGEGNFDRMKAPPLVDPNGWQSYDASAKFEPTNELKTAGTKTFELPVIPEGKHNQMPVFEFSYFDPVREQYVTLRSKPSPLVIEGEPLVAQPSTPPPTAANAPASATPAPAASKTGNDIGGLRYEEGSLASFTPLYERPGFLIGNALAGLASVGLLGSRLLRRGTGTSRLTALRRERDELWRQVRKGGDDLYEHAARLVQTEAAIRGKVEAASVDASTALRIHPLDDESALGIQSIFDTLGERLYAGASTSVTAVSTREREQILKALEAYCA